MTKPLYRRSPLTKADIAWMKMKLTLGTKTKISKGTYLAVLATAVNSNDASNKSIADSYSRSDKGLWDGDPEILISAAKKTLSDYFRGHPHFGDLTKEKALIGRVMNEIYRGGRPGHAKPKLRS